MTSPVPARRRLSLLAATVSVAALAAGCSQGTVDLSSARSSSAGATPVGAGESTTPTSSASGSSAQMDSAAACQEISSAFAHWESLRNAAVLVTKLAQEVDVFDANAQKKKWTAVYDSTLTMMELASQLPSSIPDPLPTTVKRGCNDDGLMDQVGKLGLLDDRLRDVRELFGASTGTGLNGFMSVSYFKTEYEESNECSGCSKAGISRILHAQNVPALRESIHKFLLVIPAAVTASS